MITKLTDEQVKKQEEVKDYWINLALNSGDEIDIIEAKKGIDWLYEKAGLPKVEMLVVDSPLGIQFAFNLLKKLDSSKLKNNVNNSVMNSVEDSVRNSVWNSVWNSVLNSVRDTKLKYFDFNYQNLTNIGWVAFYDYFYGFDFYDEQTKENFNIYKNFLKSGVFFSSCYSDIAIVSRRPQFIKKSSDGRLHSINSPAIQWRDGYKLYFLNGIEFPEELFLKLTSKQMSFEDILKIVDVDQRNQAMRFVGNEEREKFLKHANAEVIDEYTKETLQGGKVYYKLYELPQGELFQSPVKAMWYTCPSTGLSNFSGVPSSMKTVAEAMAWKGSDDETILSPEMWKLAIPLLDEA